MSAAGPGKSRPVTAKRSRIHVDADDEEDTPARKPRLRVSEACEPCRKRKDRCNGGKPTCDNCLRSRRECTYKQTRKRGLRTGYVRALETILGLVFVTIGGADEWLSSLLDGHAKAPPFDAQASEGLSKADSAEPLLDAWRTSAVSKQIEHVLSTTDITEVGEGMEQVNAFDSRVSQAAKIAAVVLRPQSPLIDDDPLSAPISRPTDTDLASPINPTDQPLVVQSPCLTEVPEIDPSLLAPLDTQAPVAVQAVSHDTGPAEDFQRSLPQNWEHLLEVYFARTHCWLPICEKHELLRIAYLLAARDNDSAIPTGVSHGDRTFLTVVLDYSASLIAPESNQSLPGFYSQANLCQTSLATSLRSFPEQGQKYDLGHVRALLILVLSCFQSRDLVGAWSTVGRAVYALTALDGFALRHRQSKSSANSGIHRTTLCCIALDTIVAAWMHLRPYFQRSDIAAVGLLETEGMEEWEPWKPHNISTNHKSPRQVPARVLSTFNRFIEAIGILNDVLGSTGGSQRLDEPAVSTNDVIGWSNGLAGLESGVAAGNMTPHSLNFCWFATTLTVVLQQREANGNFLSEKLNAHQKLKRLGKLLHNYSDDMRGQLFPSTCAIYISTLRFSITTGNGELQALQNLLHELEQGLETLKSVLIMPGTGRTHNIPLMENIPLLATDSCDRHHNRLDNFMGGMATLEGQFTIDATTGRVDEPSIMPLGMPVSSQAYADVQAHMLFHPERSRLTHLDNSNLETVEHISEHSDEEGLFLRLADLESDDWYAD
jgi:hypothetical protein